MAFTFGEKSEKLIHRQVRRKTGAFIIHESEHAGVIIFDADSHGGCRRAVAHSVFEQIAENAIQTRRIAHHAPIR